MSRSVGAGVVVLVLIAAACSDDSVTPAVLSPAGTGGGGGDATAVAGGTRATGGTHGDPGVGGGGAAAVAGASGTGGVAVVAGAAGDAGAAGHDAASGGGGEGVSGGVGGDSGATGGGEAGQAGQGPGICDAVMPTQLPSCSPNVPDPDGGNDCRVCLKAKCCDAWQACFGEQPRNACGYGAAVGDEIGEMDCVTLCWYDHRDGAESDDEILEACASACGACNAYTETTGNLIACAYQNCPDDCYPRP